MPYLFTGEFAFLYTLTVCRDVLSESNLYPSLIICPLTLIGVSFLKKSIDHYAPEQDRTWYKVLIGHLIFNFVAPLAKIFSIDAVLVFTATTFFATFYIIIRDSAKEFEWDNQTIQYYESVQGLLAVFQFFFLSVSIDYECSRRSDSYRCITNQSFLSVLWSSSSFYLCAILMGKIKLKEESVERPVENSVIEEESPQATGVNNVVQE